MANLTPKFKPHESLWIEAANTLNSYERGIALIEIAEMMRISLRQLTFHADSLREARGGAGSEWISKNVLATGKSEVVGSLSQRVGGKAFQHATSDRAQKRSQDAA